ncbi:MAG: hypothetical protein U1F68_15295 [Gammaproteobacteria bacterium]
MVASVATDRGLDGFVARNGGVLANLEGNEPFRLVRIAATQPHKIIGMVLILRKISAIAFATNEPR